jgi:hypothetical protein
MISQKAEEYQVAIRTVAMIAKLLAQHDIPGLLRSIETADAVGPIFDPTLWMKKSEAMAEDKYMLTQAMPLYFLGKKLEGLQAKEDAS